jgi:hypothetical protein
MQQLATHQRSFSPVGRYGLWHMPFTSLRARHHWPAVNRQPFQYKDNPRKINGEFIVSFPLKQYIK